MADTDQQWRSSIAQLGRTDANVPQDARSYLVMDPVRSFMEVIASGRTYSAGAAVTYKLTVKSVAFTSYDPTAGWPPDGQMWAEVIVNHDWEHGGSTKVDTTGWKITADGKPVTADNPDAANSNRNAILTYPVTVDTTSVGGS